MAPYLVMHDTITRKFYVKESIPSSDLIFSQAAVDPTNNNSSVSAVTAAVDSDSTTVVRREPNGNAMGPGR